MWNAEIQNVIKDGFNFPAAMRDFVDVHASLKVESVKVAIFHSTNTEESIYCPSHLRMKRSVFISPPLILWKYRPSQTGAAGKNSSDRSVPFIDRPPYF
jgi:hypothetical protein